MAISKFRLLLLVIIVGILTMGCQADETREWPKAPGWSRIPVIGHTQIGDPVPIAFDDEGNLFAFFVSDEGGGDKPKVVAFNRQMEVLWIRVFDLPLVQPDKPALVWDGAALNLFWLSNQNLLWAQMSADGDVLLSPKVVSGTVPVGSFSVARDPMGELSLWFAGPRQHPGIYAFDRGDIGGEIVVVDETGISPSLRFDSAGTLHAGWVIYPLGFATTHFWYGTYDGGVVADGEATAVYSVNLSTTDIFVGPQLGIDTTQAYLFWNVSVRTGLEAGKILTEFIEFPLNEPSEGLRPQMMLAPEPSELAYDWLPEGGFKTGSRVNPTDYPQTPIIRGGVAPNQYQTNELAVAFSAEVRHQFRKFQDQIGVQFWRDGEPQGHQLISFTSRSSLTPFLVSDADQYLYVTWLERGDGTGYDIYFASTAPDVIAALAPLTAGDLLTLLREVVFGLLSGAVLAPIVVPVWLIAPMVMLFVTSFIRKEGRGVWTVIGTVTSFVLAIAAYWFSKMITLPGINDYVPLSAWLPGMSAGLQTILQYGLPVAFVLIALFVAWRLTYDRGNRSPLYFMAVFGGVDGVLTLAIYGVLIYSTF